MTSTKLVEERTRCPDPACGAYSTPDKPAHSPRCQLASIEYKASEMLRYYEAWLEKNHECNSLYKRMKEQITLWQGKCAILRHENNKIRTRLRQLEGGK